MKEVKKFRFIPILLAVILAVFLLLSSVTTIPAGHTGVVTTFGKVSGTVLGEGLHFKLPFITNVVKIDNRVLKTEVSSSSASKDRSARGQAHGCFPPARRPAASQAETRGCRAPSLCA